MSCLMPQSEALTVVFAHDARCERAVNDIHSEGLEPYAQRER